MLREVGRRAGLRDVPAGVVAAAACLAMAAVVWAGWRWWPRSAPRVSDSATEVFASAPAGEADAAGAAAGGSAAEGTATAATTKLFVHVAGMVRRPGVYELPAGSRVVDAVEAAGGAVGDAAPDALNLARVLVDGEQVLVPTQEQAARQPSPAGGTSDAGATQNAGGSTLRSTSTPLMPCSSTRFRAWGRLPRRRSSRSARPADHSAARRTSRESRGSARSASSSSRVWSVSSDRAMPLRPSVPVLAWIAAGAWAAVAGAETLSWRTTANLPLGLAVATAVAAGAVALRRHRWFAAVAVGLVAGLSIGSLYWSDLGRESRGAGSSGRPRGGGRGRERCDKRSVRRALAHTSDRPVAGRDGGGRLATRIDPCRRQGWWRSRLRIRPDARDQWSRRRHRAGIAGSGSAKTVRRADGLPLCAVPWARGANLHTRSCARSREAAARSWPEWCSATARRSRVRAPTVTSGPPA